MSHAISPAGKLLLLLPVALLPISAQTGVGVVRGIILDATEAAVVGAKVTLTNEKTSISRTTKTSTLGAYYFGSVLPGPYALTVEKAGFKKWSGSLTVEVGQTVVVDPALEVGDVEATIEVTGAAPVITTEGMEVSDVKDDLRIHQLPINGRFVTNLFDLTPGVEDGNSPRINGMKVGSTEMQLDGISLVDRYGGAMSRVQPGLGAIQEFRIETVGSSAQYSRPATISLVTKSGTNEFHGSVFETHRNNFAGLRARRREDGEEASQLIRNEFGVSAGGPFIKNRAFWFVNYEGLRQRTSPFHSDHVPTTAMWNGDFSQIIDSNGRQVLIYDPMTTGTDGTRIAFPNLRIPRNRISQFSRTLHSVTAQPTNNISPFQGENFEAFYPDTIDIDTLTLKGDYRFSDGDSVSGRFTRSVRARKLSGGLFGSPKPGNINAFGTSRWDLNIYSSFVRWNHVFSTTFLNELQASSHRSPNRTGTLADDADWPEQLGLPNPFGAKGWPGISTSGPFSSFWWGADDRRDENMTAYQFEDNATWISGRHSIRFGGKMRYEYNNIRWIGAPGAHDIGSAWTAQYDRFNNDVAPRTGEGLASLVLGLPTFLSNDYERGFFYFEQQEFGLYFHDSWKVHPRLTLELGLRWDKWTPYREKFNRLVNVDLDTFADRFQVVTPGNTPMENLPGVPASVLESWGVRGLSWVTAEEIGFPSRLLPADNNNFGPRMGAAFRLTDRWVLRGGYGEYFWTMPLSQIVHTATLNPPLRLRFQNFIESRNGQDDFYAVRNAPAPDDFIGRATVPTDGIRAINPRAQGMTVWDARGWRDNRMHAWHVTLERELMKDTALRLSYIDNHGRDLEQRFSVNARESEWNYQARTGKLRPGNRDLLRINPDWNFSATNHTGFSNAHSFQAEVERRFSKGLAFQWFYVYSHAMTTNDAPAFSNGFATINSTSGTTLAPENIDILGAPNLSYDQRLGLGYFNSDAVPSHRVRWNSIYSLPFGRGRRFGGNAFGWLNHVIGGWEIATIGAWQSGNWSSVSSSRYLFGDPTLSADERLVMNIFGRRQRLWFRGDFDPTRASEVDQTALQQLVPADRSQRILRPVGEGFDNRIPQLLVNGSVRLTTISDNVNWNARNFFRGPGAWNVDFSVLKHFQITEKVKSRFSADFFNLFNHPNDVSPNSTTGLQDLSLQTNEPRIIQLSLRVEW